MFLVPLVLLVSLSVTSAVTFADLKDDMRLLGFEPTMYYYESMSPSTCLCEPLSDYESLAAVPNDAEIPVDHLHIYNLTQINGCHKFKESFRYDVADRFFRYYPCPKECVATCEDIQEVRREIDGVQTGSIYSGSFGTLAQLVALKGYSLREWHTSQSRHSACYAGVTGDAALEHHNEVYPTSARYVVMWKPGSYPQDALVLDTADWKLHPAKCPCYACWPALQDTPAVSG